MLLRAIRFLPLCVLSKLDSRQASTGEDSNHILVLTMCTSNKRALRRCIFIALLTQGNGQCVGTLAGVPLHPAVDGAPAFNADLTGLYSAVIDPLHPCNLYITVLDRVLIADCNRTLTSLAGGAAVQSRTSTVAADAELQYPNVQISSSGGIFIADSTSIRSLDENSGLLHMLAGNITAGSGWSPDGTLATSAQVTPGCLHIAPNGDIYFCDYGSTGHQVRVLRRSGTDAGRIFTIAGNGSMMLAVDGALATETGLSDVWDVFFDAGSGDVCCRKRLLQLPSRSPDLCG